MTPSNPNSDLSTNYGFGQFHSIGEAFTRLVIPGFSIAAAAVTIYFIVGSIRILASGGDKEAIAAGRGMITHAIVGFVLLILMFLIFKYIPSFFGIDFKLL